MPGTASIDPLELGGDALFDHGVTIARLGRALRSFFDPSAGRVLLWDVQHALSLRPMADEVEDRRTARSSKGCSIASKPTWCRGGRRFGRR